MTRLLACALVFLFASLGHADNKLPVTDDKVREITYDKKYTTPEGFFKDPALKKEGANLYFHQADWFSDKKDDARKIIENYLAKPSNIAVKEIQEDNETPRSFDFRAGTIWFRVHKPGYFTWKGKRVDEILRKADGKNAVELGTLKVKLTKESVKEFAEYAWLISNHQMGGAKVLVSETTEEKDSITHTLYTTQTTYGDFGLTDQIRVVRWTISVDAKNGDTTLAREQVKTIQGQKR